jgi:ribonucleoside-diphosphate reductase alpha chain
MLLRLGIMSTLALRRDAGSRPMPNGRGGQAIYQHKSQWEIIISKDNIEEFGAKVGFSHPTKNETLDNLIASLVRKPNCEAFLARVKQVNILPPEPVFDCPVEGLGIYDAGGFCSLSGMR